MAWMRDPRAAAEAGAAREREACRRRDLGKV